MAIVITERISPEQAVDEAIARIEQISEPAADECRLSLRGGDER